MQWAPAVTSSPGGTETRVEKLGHVCVQALVWLCKYQLPLDAFFPPSLPSLL